MFYAIQKNAAGATVTCAAWSSLPETPADEDGTPGSPIYPDGFTACSAADYQAAVSAMRNTLQIQAQNALVVVQQQATLTVAMGGTFSAAMQTYVRALQAIANGTDTTSTVLPAEPQE
ncbi:hypothetical protein NFI95_15495 [Acetobacteraceae bacterium KSS8]|uniref:Uncharacterized protein n=1 Tax=Endosaccharibacter trunci TaxID=2812733 RepID=A0ABT1WAT3_9PROT|nr:hypothetical protein [Acetobacteraceae bacterium KSS8]